MRRTPQTSITKSADQDNSRHFVAEWAVTIALLLFGTTTLCQAFVIPTGSMEGSLLVGDHVLVDKLSYAPAGTISKHILPYQEPQHGDVIVFRYPPDLKQMLVKRLIGVPGDRIRIANGVIYRNGAKLNEPYVHHNAPYQPPLDSFPWQCCRPVKEQAALERQRAMLAQAQGEIVVPPNNYFAMGDNRDNSSDSRYWGFVPRENIVGKPILVYWSYDSSTQNLSGESIGSLLTHFIDLGQNFFTKTRWERTFRLVRGFPDSQLPVGVAHAQ
jgi:signal peptidase I